MQLHLLIAFIFRYILLIIHKFNKLMAYCYKNKKNEFVSLFFCIFAVILYSMMCLV